MVVRAPSAHRHFRIRARGKKDCPKQAPVRKITAPVKIPPPSRRAFVRQLAGATLLGAVPSWLRAEPIPGDDLVTISIFHTTDLHGHILPTTDYRGRPNLGGFARCVTQINRWRSENANSLLIDIGDIYQGTEFALADQGRSMIDLFNLLRYDAWLIGNHEFDWGIEPFQQALARSQVPVLAANTIVHGGPAGMLEDRGEPLAKIQPLILREIAGIKLAIIGLTTPGMPFWFPADFTAGLEFQNPIEPVRHSIATAKSLGASAIVLAGHMGLKERTGGDDFANRVMALTAEFPEAAVFIAGHTHQDIPSRLTNKALFTQADHFGVHVGRVDLLFDRNSRKLLHQTARTELMDQRISLDPTILSRTQAQLHTADEVLAESVGELAESLGVSAPPGEPSEVERLIAAAITETLAQRGIALDGVFHGLFEDRHVFKKGPKTVGDLWEILPYENYLVTAELLPTELEVVMNEVLQSRESRSLVGFRMNAADRRLTNLRLDNGRPLDPAKRYRIAFNTFDSQSAGHRFMKLRGLLERPEAKRAFHPVQTREALIDYFRRHKVVRLPPTPALAA